MAQPIKCPSCQLDFGRLCELGTHQRAFPHGECARIHGRRCVTARTEQQQSPQQALQSHTTNNQHIHNQHHNEQTEQQPDDTSGSGGLDDRLFDTQDPEPLPFDAFGRFCELLEDRDCNTVHSA